MSGPKETKWEGARFKLLLYFTAQFPEEPPHVYFLTVPLHPNIDIATGRPCVAFLEASHWRQDIELLQLLIHLQVCK